MFYSQYRRRHKPDVLLVLVALVSLALMISLTVQIRTLSSLQALEAEQQIQGELWGIQQPRMGDPRDLV
ncbi:MAG: hypothetical protein GY703_24815 [Gammaproteobacteria bacterium]|nr:hypothetical protein [Gammaproteobacteria bacterium]